MSDEAKQFYSSTEVAYTAGLRAGKELEKQAAEEAGQHEEGGSSGGGLTWEAIRNMSQEEHAERKAEVDAFLEGQSK